MIFASKYFKLQEFVPKSIYDVWGERSMWFIDERIVELADGLREYFGLAITINNWHLGGQFSQRGFRPPDTTVGGKLSHHKFGRAIDLNIAGLTSQYIYQHILENEAPFMAMGITTLENIDATPGWLHVDIRWTGMDKILIVNP